MSMKGSYALMSSVLIVTLMGMGQVIAQAALPTPQSKMENFLAHSRSVTIQVHTAMAATNSYRAPSTSPHLETLNIVSVGVSLDIYRQGQIWSQLQQQNSRQVNSLHVGNILPTDPKKYPVAADDKDSAWDKRSADALELALRDFPEAWPIPTITVVGGWDRNQLRPQYSNAEVETMTQTMVEGLSGDAGLHWHQFDQLDGGEIYSDTPEDTVERIFRVFEDHPDMPALLVYVAEGLNMKFALSSKNTRLLGAGSGPRQPGELINAIVALVVSRPERVNWLRGFAPDTKVNGVPLYPGFSGWKRQPKEAFVASPFIPQPWTKRGFEQWDALKILGQLHRPVVVSLNSAAGTPLTGDALTTVLAGGYAKATIGIAPPPSRIFFDNGQQSVALAEFMPALKAANSPLDLLQSTQSYDLTQRLGDTGAASPFVGIALATMATYLNADTSVVIPLRRADQATLITITSATPGKKPTDNPFGVNLMPQTASSDEPSAIIAALNAADNAPPAPTHAVVPAPSAAERTASRHQLDDFLADGAYVDPYKPKE